MKENIKGIYLNHFPYSETSVILKMFTEQYGSKSFLIKGARGKKKSPVLQPFHFLEITCNYKEDKDLNLASNIQLWKPSTSITVDLRKSTIAIFLTEMLYRSIKEEETNKELYAFLESAIDFFDHHDFDANFHLAFLIELSKYIGIYPAMPAIEGQNIFSVEAGTFEFPKTLHSGHLDKVSSILMMRLIKAGFPHSEDINFSKDERTKLLNALVRYYEVQMSLNKGTIASHKILQAVFE